jgi:hypothetical protein
MARAIEKARMQEKQIIRPTNESRKMQRKMSNIRVRNVLLRAAAAHPKEQQRNSVIIPAELEWKVVILGEAALRGSGGVSRSAHLWRHLQKQAAWFDDIDALKSACEVYRALMICH